MGLKRVRFIKVGMSASLSGQFQMQGRQALAGLRAWASDVNHSGELYVRALNTSLPVTVVFRDDGSQPDMARLNTEELLLIDAVDLLMGPYSSALALAAARIAEKHEVVLWNQGGAADSIYRQGYRWVVGILSPAGEYLAGLPQLVQQTNPEASTLAIVRAATGSFPRIVSSGVERSAERLGFRTVLLHEYDPSTRDFSYVANQVQNLRPHLLVAVGRIQNDLLLAKQMVEKRISLGAAGVVATPIQQFQDALGDDVEGFIGPSQWEPTGTYSGDYGPSTEQVLESLRRQSSLPIDYPMVQAYAAGLVAQRCVEVAGTLEQAALRSAASRLDFSTFYGRFKIDPESGKQIGRSVLLVQWQKGRKVIVWPPEQSQGTLVYPWR